MPKITGAERVTARLNGLVGEKMVRNVGKALLAAGEEVRAEASRLITENSSGGHSGGKHQHVVSLPGHPPNEEWGTLRTHIETTQPEPLRVEVSSSAPYSAPLEFGTSKMLARPFMGPAARSKKKEAIALVRKAVSAALKE